VVVAFTTHLLERFLKVLHRQAARRPLHDDVGGHTRVQGLRAVTTMTGYW
jgi:hypothetical protein